MTISNDAELSDFIKGQIGEMNFDERSHIYELYKAAEKDHEDAVGRCSDTILNKLEEKKEALLNDILNTAVNKTNTYGAAAGLSAQAATTLANRNITSKVMDERSQQIKEQLAALNDAKNNKVRMAEINTYYAQRYRAYGGVAKLGSFLMVIILALSILKKNGILPDTPYNILVAIIIVIGGGHMLYTLYILYNRDNMDFQEKEWSFNSSYKVPDTVEKRETNNDSDENFVGGRLRGARF